jgi:hypothetical protein
VTSRRALALGAAATAAAAALLAIRFPWIVGPPSWRWTYAANPLWPRAAGSVALFAALLIVAGAWTRAGAARSRREAAFLVALLALATALDVAFLALSPRGLATLPAIHFAPWVTGYFWSARAARTLPELLASYPEVVASLTHHAKTHPPGLVALNRLALDAFRASDGAVEALLAGAHALGVPRGALRGVDDAELAALVAVGAGVVLVSRLALVPAYLLARRLHGIAAARAATLLLVVVPSLLLFAGEFDTLYVPFVLTALFLAVRGGSLSIVAAGLVIGLSCLLTFVAAVFLALVALVDALCGGPRSLRARSLRAALLGAGFLAPLVAFEALTGCSIARVFAAAYAVQHEVLIPEQNRRWLTWVFWNVADFFLFLGPAVAVLFASEAARAVRAAARVGPRALAGALADRGDAFALAVVVFLALLDLSGLIPAETSRVWLFLAAPAAIVAVRRGPPGGTRGLALLLALAFAFALVAKGTLLMIDVAPSR